MLKVGIIGAGTVGTALAVRLNSKGYRIAGVSSRRHSSAENLSRDVGNCPVFNDGQGVVDAADLVFITTPDAAIPVVTSQMKWHAGQSVIHCSGADSTTILEPARKLGAHVGAFHPLQTFASVKHAIENIPGSTFAIEADEQLMAILKNMAADLGGRWIVLKASDKVLYHAAAVMSCNYLVTLVKLSTDLWQTFGVNREQAIQALLPLIRGTINNIENVGIPQCLTGPIARGDTGTVSKHINALKKSAPDLLSTYCELGSKTIPVALAKGKINQQQAEELRVVLMPKD